MIVLTDSILDAFFSRLMKDEGWFSELSFAETYICFNFIDAWVLKASFVLFTTGAFVIFYAYV